MILREELRKLVEAYRTQNVEGYLRTGEYPPDFEGGRQSGIDDMADEIEDLLKKYPEEQKSTISFSKYEAINMAKDIAEEKLEGLEKAVKKVLNNKGE